MGTWLLTSVQCVWGECLLLSQWSRGPSSDGCSEDGTAGTSVCGGKVLHTAGPSHWTCQPRLYLPSASGHLRPLRLCLPGPVLSYLFASISLLDCFAGNTKFLQFVNSVVSSDARIQTVKICRVQYFSWCSHLTLNDAVDFLWSRTRFRQRGFCCSCPATRNCLLSDLHVVHWKLQPGISSTL